MKPKIHRWLPAFVAGLALVGATSTARAQSLEQSLATFDEDISATSGLGGTDLGGGVTIPTLTTTEWSDVDGPGGPGGSLYATVNWPDRGTSWTELQLNFDVTWPGIDATKWLNVEYDIKIDQANSHVGPNGNYGFTQPVGQSWDGSHGWVELASATLIATNGWQHVSANLSPFPAVLNRLVIRLASNGSQNVTNTVKYWIDNIKLTAPPLPAPTLGPLLSATAPGLTFIPCVASQWQRVMVYPNPAAQGAYFGWYGKGNPVSYSFTISSFPTVNDYAANVFLIPNIHMRDGNAASTSVDWACTNGLFFNITADTNRPAANWNVSLSAKTNMVTDGSNPNFQVLNFNYSRLPVGTWTLRFDNDTDFTIIAPDGFTTNAALPADVAQLVSGYTLGDTQLTPYFGIMPRTTEHVGEPAVYSRVRIQGTPIEIDDRFSAAPAALDTNTWSKLADYPAGVFVSSSDLMHYATWNTPNDQGFHSLIVAGAVTGPWKEMGVDSSKWLLVNGTRRALIYQSGVHAALGGSETNAAYFQLIKRAFTGLQVLLPGETPAPGTATGKTGTPAQQQVGVAFDVTVNAVDATWHRVNNVTDTVSLTSSDPSATLPVPAALVGGTGTFSVTLGSAGTFTVTATDDTDGSKTPDTSSSGTATQ
jgi:hypothetical protein